MKYIHVDGDDGMIYVKDEPNHYYNGWVYEVLDNYTFTITLKNMEEQINIYELFDSDPNARLILKM